MDIYENALRVMIDLFSEDRRFAMATAEENKPSVRMVDTFYDSGSFYVVTYAQSQKVRELTENPRVSLCCDLYRFDGNAINIGHPLKAGNEEIRDRLIKVFAPWYFAHNNENDDHMCYIRIELETGFLYKDGTGFRVNFLTKEAEEFPFESDILAEP